MAVGRNIVSCCHVLASYLSACTAQELVCCVCKVDLSSNEPNGTLGPYPRPDRGAQPNNGWWAPVAQRYIKEVGSRGLSHEVRQSRLSPPTTLTDLEGRAVSDGKHRRRHCTALPFSDRHCQ
jgi:hypothetical protein